MKHAIAVIGSLVAFTGLNAAWADETDGDSPPKACISTDPAISDSAFWASTAMAFFANEEYAESVATVDACFKYWGPDAGQQQKALWEKGKKCPRTGEVSKRDKRKIDANGLMNDVSVALWAKARSLQELDQVESAKKAYAQCIYMACGRAWDPQGWYWSPAEDCAEHARGLVEATPSS